VWDRSSLGPPGINLTPLPCGHDMDGTSSPNTDAIRVAIDVGPLYGHRTGVGLATAGMVEALARRSDVALEPFVVSFRADPQPGHTRLKLPGIVASHLWSRSDRPNADRWLADGEVVHGTNYVVPPTSRACVVSVYDCWFLNHPDQSPPIVRRAAARLRRAVAAGAHVHASSESTASQARELLATDRVTVIPLGPPPAPPTSAQLPVTDVAHWLAGRPYVLAIGTEERRKDLPLLIEAFGVVAAADPDVALILTGADGDDSPSVQRAIATSAAADRVRRLGPVTDDVKHALLRRASVLAYPSRDEGFGFPILEAQMAGTPVVATRAGSIPEVAGERGALIIDGRGRDELASALMTALDDGGVRLGLIEAGHRNVNRFSWDATAAGLVELYRTALGAAR
jgi:glycosyltransferase involved in cell wall biosynthesis